MLLSVIYDSQKMMGGCGLKNGGNTAESLQC